MKITSKSAHSLYTYYKSKGRVTSHNEKQTVLVSFSTPSLTFSQGSDGWNVRLRPQPLNPLALIQLEDLIIRRYK